MSTNQNPFWRTVVDHLSTLPAGTCMSMQEIGRLPGAPNWVKDSLKTAFKLGVIERVARGGNIRLTTPGGGATEAVHPTSTLPPVEPAPDREPFNAALWLDGELVLKGVSPLADDPNGFLLTKEQVQQLREFLAPDSIFTRI